MITTIIKEHMEHLNLSNNDLSLLTGVTERTIRNILNKKTKPDLDTLTKFEEAFRLEKGDLYPFLDIPTYDIESQEVFDTLDEITGNLYAKETLVTKMKKILSGSLENYKNFLSEKSLDFYKFRDTDLAYFWIALNEKSANGIKVNNKYESKNKSKTFNKYLKIMFSKEEVYKRIDKMKEYLLNNGIILINSPFIKGSSLRGATLIKNKTRYIFLNDMNKREYSYIFSLGHELLHIFNKDFKEDNDFLANKILNYLESNKIDHEIKIAIDLVKKNGNKTFSEQDWKYLHDNTKLKINFGEQKDFILNNLD